MYVSVKLKTRDTARVRELSSQILVEYNYVYSRLSGARNIREKFGS